MAYGTWADSSLEEQHGGSGQKAQGEDGRVEEGARGADEAVGQGGAVHQPGGKWRGGGQVMWQIKPAKILDKIRKTFGQNPPN